MTVNGTGLNWGARWHLRRSVVEEERDRIMWYSTLRSRLALGVCLIATIVFSCYSIGYWREAVSDGFTGLATTKVISSTFLAIIGWIGLIIQYWDKRGTD